jgi:myo-inositol 2-dehydrogenase / D-chiro-inositol 1-dehydrogenase
MRLGLIGLGRIGAFHAETLSTQPSVTSLVVTDARPETTRTVAERLGVEAADSPEKLLAAGLDGVVIAAATDAHPELITAAADAGLPVFCEKPVARSITEGVAVSETGWVAEAATLSLAEHRPVRVDEARDRLS